MDNGQVVLESPDGTATLDRAAAEESGMVRLNLGAGASNLPGFIPIDIKDGRPVYPLEYADNSVDEIYASHVLEHFSHRQTLLVLRDWVRALKPGGRIRIAVPDADKALAMLKAGQIPLNLYEGYLFGGHVDDDDKHGAIFSEYKLGAIMRYCGLDAVGPWKSDNNDCASLAVSLNLEGVKRAFTIKESPATVAVISQPRVAYTDAMLCLHRALQAIPSKQAVVYGGVRPDIIYCGGAYWEKYLSKGIEAAIKHCEDGDYLLFADYDSIFTPDDVLALRDHLQQNPNVSVAYAVQASRHNDKALVEMPFLDYSGSTTAVPLAHFGLTMIRRQVFQYLPRPWLWSLPGEGDDWDGQAHCDADILFWKILGEHGHRVEQLNHIQAGHMDLCVKWLTPGGIIWQPIQHYNKMGRPKEVGFDPRVLKMDSDMNKAMES